MKSEIQINALSVIRAVMISFYAGGEGSRNNMSERLPTRWLIILGFFILWNAGSQASEPFADIHTHFNWDQAEITNAKTIMNKLREHNVLLTVVMGTPSELALAMKKEGGRNIIPFFSPYTHELGKQDWHLDKELLAKAENALASGLYQGIGEIHFMAGFSPRIDNANFVGLMNLARKFKVPVLIHVDAADEKYFLDICRTYPEVKMLLAHAGGNLYARHVEAILEQCANTWVEFSARDPWRYGGLTDKDNQLLIEWRQLVLKFSDRIMTGTDPVWRVTRTRSWDMADEGWDYYDKLYAYHQDWTKGLPKPVQKNIRWLNALKFFDIKEADFTNSAH